MTDVSNQENARPVNAILLILAAILLNVGLFIVLVIFAPFVSGLIVGYLSGKAKEGTGVGFIGALLSYFTIMLLTEFLTGFPTDPLIILSSILLMGVIGALGGILGAWIRTRTK
ncbi:MAG: hypothetical protein ACFFF9_02795 [Candidatus Thorarchaeota archaeon]